MPSPAAPRTPGYRFKDGKLMIFREDEVMLIRGWDEPSAVRNLLGSWDAFVPEFRLVAPYRRPAKGAQKKAAKNPPPPAAGDQLAFDLFEESASRKPAAPKPTPLAEQRKRAFDSFRFSLPKDVAKSLQDFRSHQWNLLMLLAHDKGVLDLAKANPVLAYAVADWYADYPRSKLDFGRMPQRDLLKLLKLPDTAAQVKLFRKIPPASIDPRLWKALLTVMRRTDSASAKLLAHVPTINLGVMELILTPHIRPALTPALLEEVAADPKEKYRGAVAATLRDTAAMKDELEDGRPLPALASVARIRDLHGKVSVDFQKLRALRKEHGTLPLPPLPGIKGSIIPLRNQAELVAEGREQKNCVASYTARVETGECYIYRVLHPSRATLCIRRLSDGNWGISELEASCNRKVDAETRKFVEQWLEPYRLGV
ncbi:PcfJ domain-containing protein [Akkermansiaceae bacterium]|nr:PcfJ domain-containing protein [Akkermansiaceae bacterium]